MRLRFSYEDERGGIDFGEVVVDAGSFLRQPGDAPLLASRSVKLDAEGGAGGEAPPWFSALTIEVVE